MREFFFSNQFIKRCKYSIMVTSIALVLNVISLLVNTKPTYWTPVTLKLLGVACLIYLIIRSVICIREPSIKINNNCIMIKVDGDIDYWETSWKNISHIEIKKEYLNKQSEYVYFKQPVTRDSKFFGLILGKLSKDGFYLHYFDKNAIEEIKARLE